MSRREEREVGRRGEDVELGEGKERIRETGEWKREIMGGRWNDSRRKRREEKM